ncbi:Ig-like domain-containing protein [Dyadobacter sp. 3J3]|uniref:Ig-like domain-containing protein n=1 Tax=Dyadobacter sp. 3J3 TaxID=2606600 RepID=UPI00135BC1AB|nr:Ig-like domain-containing protein [Dyadobacter sp. 3J3]
MKKISLSILFALVVSIVFAQDPSLSTANVAPSPATVGGAITASFNFQNVSSQDLTNPDPDNNPTVIRVSLNKIKPTLNGGNPVVTGAGAAYFNWSAECSGNCNGTSDATDVWTIIGLQNSVVPGAPDPFTISGGPVSISGTVTAPSTSAEANALNGSGFNANIAPGAGGDIDLSPGSNVQATYTFTVNPPVTTPDATSTPVNTPVTISVLSNDTPGSAAIDPASVKLIDPATNTPVTSVTVPNQGTYMVNSNGTVTFTPLATFSGVATPINYTVYDVNGLTSNPSAITVTVTPTAPTAVADVATTPAGTPVTLTATTNDTPGSAAIDPASVKLIDPATNTPVTSVTVPNQGTYTVNPNGTVTFTPVAGFTGTATPVSYTETDVNGLVSNPATITITVTATPPTAIADVATTPAGTPVTLTATTNDTPGSAAIDPASVKLIDPATNTPVTSVTVPNQGTYTVNPNGTVTFTPVAGFTGTATPVSYTETDVNGLVSNPATITITVTATPPTAIADVATTPAGTPVTLTATTNDTPGSAAIDPASVKLIDPATNTPVTSVTVPNQGTYTVNPNGTVTFTPVAGFTGTATPVSYTETDVNGLVSNPATITITVTATPPVANNDSGTSQNGAPVDITVLTNDTPGSSPLDPTTVKLIDPSTGTPSTSVTIPGEGTYTVDPATGVVKFTPDPTLTTPITSTINYTVTDTGGNTSNPATITINATPLPVTLTVFKVSKEGQTAKLDWTTTEESNSDYFEVQHSTTGKDWHVIGKVASHGESATEKKYTFSDSNPSQQAENLYRLKMVDKDATFAYSRIQSVKFESLTKGESLALYPNPAVDELSFKGGSDKLEEVTISDMSGRLVFKGNSLSSSSKIDVKGLLPGMYVLKVKETNGLITVHKIVITK